MRSRAAPARAPRVRPGAGHRPLIRSAPATSTSQLCPRCATGPTWGRFAHPYNSLPLPLPTPLRHLGCPYRYADLGHFNAAAISLSFCCFVFPCLVVTYMGQAAYLIAHPAAYVEPYWTSVPKPMLWPMLVVATLASVVASQALITGVFSITRQAMALGVLPRLKVTHTSADVEGQIYIGVVRDGRLGRVVHLLIAAVTAATAAARGNCPRARSVAHAAGCVMPAARRCAVPSLKVHPVHRPTPGPQINWILMLGCIGMVAGFQRPEAMSLAYVSPRAGYRWPRWRGAVRHPYQPGFRIRASTHQARGQAHTGMPWVRRRAPPERQPQQSLLPLLGCCSDHRDVHHHMFERSCDACLLRHQPCAGYALHPVLLWVARAPMVAPTPLACSMQLRAG